MPRVAPVAVLICATLVTWAVPTPPAVAGTGEIERAPTFVEDVNEAAERGTQWLLSRQNDDGGFGPYIGYPAASTAIAYLTLAVCDVDPEDPQMVAAYAALRREYVAARRGRRETDEPRTNTAALVMMAIEEHARRTATSAAKGTQHSANGDEVVAIGKQDAAWMAELARYMTGIQKDFGAWSYGQRVDRYRTGRDPIRYDHSNTQYALLGLKSASRCGIAIDPEVYARALRHLVAAQERQGPEVPRRAPKEPGRTYAHETDHARGWGYFSLTTTDLPGGFEGINPAFGSMTAGCLGAVVICRSELLASEDHPAQLDARAETSVRDGIAWLGQEFAVTRNPGLDGWHDYWLYALERAGVLADVDWIGHRDSYCEGASYLVEHQNESGAWLAASNQKKGFWDMEGQRLVDTCFALLFLKKGTLPVARGGLTPSGEGERIDFAAAANAEGSDLVDLVDLVIARRGRAKTDEDRAALHRGLASVGARVVVPLLRRMGAGNDRQRAPAHAVLVAISDVDLPFAPDAPAESRLEALSAWEEWALGHQDRLAFDEDTRRLVVR